MTVLIDQATKANALSALSPTQRVPLLGDLLGLQLAFNPGALLSLGSDVTWLLTLLGVVATAALAIAAVRSRTPGWALGIGLVLGGAVGNLIDRLFFYPAFGRGYVIDFLAYGDLFIGNLADIALGAGGAVLLFTLWRQRQRRRPSSPPEDELRTSTVNEQEA
ncbi:signal peptidase II [Microbacterium sp.]|uniref:signal peptidase II n=1 Tax=Microbacterium sp. TaxID=51671 RepID=UPI003735EA4A